MKGRPAVVLWHQEIDGKRQMDIGGLWARGTTCALILIGYGSEFMFINTVGG